MKQCVYVRYVTRTIIKEFYGRKVETFEVVPHYTVRIKNE